MGKRQDAYLKRHNIIDITIDIVNPSLINRWIFFYRRLHGFFIADYTDFNRLHGFLLYAKCKNKRIGKKIQG